MDQKKKILEKLKTFCEDDQKIKNDIWKCHYESPGKDYCVLQDNKKDTTDQTVESFNSLFLDLDCTNVKRFDRLE